MHFPTVIWQVLQVHGILIRFPVLVLALPCVGEAPRFYLSGTAIKTMNSCRWQAITCLSLYLGKCIPLNRVQNLTGQVRLLRDNLLNGECGPAVHTDKESTERLGYRKICAKFASGVRFGVGFALERTCGQECTKCTGTTFERQCRFFTFKPHYGVKTEIKTRVPKIAVRSISANKCCFLTSYSIDCWGFIQFV